MKNKVLVVSLLTASLSIASNTSPVLWKTSQVAQAGEICNSRTYPDSDFNPSSEKREFKSNRYGFSFQVPGNYSVVAHTKDIFFVMPKSSFPYYKCTIENNEFYMDDYNWPFYILGGIVVKTTEIPASQRGENLQALAKTDGFMQELHNTTVNGLEVFEYSTWMTATNYKVANVLSSDRRYLVSISYSYRDEQEPQRSIVNTILENFRFQ